MSNSKTFAFNTILTILSIMGLAYCTAEMKSESAKGPLRTDRDVVLSAAATADIMPSAEYRACLDKKVNGLPSNATFFPALRGSGQGYYSNSLDEMQGYFHKECMSQFQAWMANDCLQVTHAGAQACLQRDATIIQDEIHQLGNQIIGAHAAGAIGPGLMIRKGE